MSCSVIDFSGSLVFPKKGLWTDKNQSIIWNVKADQSRRGFESSSFFKYIDVFKIPSITTVCLNKTCKKL